MFLEYCDENTDFHNLNFIYLYFFVFWLQRIKDYVHGQKNEPLVIYGKSGSGKTSVMAKAAMCAFDWTNGKAAVVLR